MSRREEVEALGGAFHTEENWNTILYERCRTLADEVDALRADLKALREGKAELNGIMEAMTKGANESAIIDKLLAMLEPGSVPYKNGEPTDDQYEIEKWRIMRELHARACEIAGRKE